MEICMGECHGIIAFEPRGSDGFGYDPVFYFSEIGKTMAELPLDIKNQISHRGQAACKARTVLENLAENVKP
jgi:XTP/dITP diphosphohydrolase